MRRFVVSPANRKWVVESDNIFLLDPSHVNAIKEIHGGGENIQISQAMPLITNRKTLTDAHEYINEKLYLYYEILRKRLNSTHGVKFGDEFWKTLLLLPLLRHICACHQLFSQLRANFKPLDYEVATLSKSDYFTPTNFDEHFKYILSDFCQEQLFSQYVDIFHANLSRSEFGKIDCNIAVLKDKDENGQENISAINKLVRNIKRLENVSIKSLARRFLSLRSPFVGILNCYFTNEGFHKIVMRSFGKCQKLTLKEYDPKGVCPNLKLRAVVFEFNDNFDAFDKYCFSSLRYLMPTSLLEEFGVKFDYYNKSTSQWPLLKYIVSEAWIASEETSFVISILRRNGVKLITNEHNYLSEQYVGANNRYIFDVTDVFCNLGWDPAGAKKVLRSGSLFDWKLPIVKSDMGLDIKLLIVSGLPQVRMTEYSAAYSDCGPHAAQLYLDSTKVFLETIKNNLGQVYFRAYPQSVVAEWPTATWDQKYYLHEYLPLLRKYDESSESSAKTLMAHASLVVFNYVGTSLWEALINDVPLVFILNEGTHHLKESFTCMFDELREVGICQTSPYEAGVFVNGILDKVDSWWLREDVRRARKNFLDLYFGSPNAIINYLVSLK